MVKITDPGATYERLCASLAQVEAEIAHYESRGWTALVKIARKRQAGIRGRMTHIRRAYWGEARR